MYAIQNQNKSYLSITEWWVKISTGSTRIVHSQHNYLDTFIPHCSTRLYIEGASPCPRSWHSFTAVSEDWAFLYGGYSNDRTPLSMYKQTME